MFDELELATLAATSRLTSETYVPTDGDRLLEELARIGYEPDEVKMWWLLSRLSDQGFVTYHKAGGMDIRGSANIALTAYGREALARAAGDELEPEQEELLASMVEAAREVPRPRRIWGLMRAWQGAILDGPGGRREVLETDMTALEAAGVLKVARRTTSEFQYVLAPAAMNRYATVRKAHGGPDVRVEQEVRRLLTLGTLRRDYPAAYQKWADAEALVWCADRDRELTTIGHKCREAMQAFATTAVERYAPVGVGEDAALVKRRVGAVIATMLPELGEKQAELLKALGSYLIASFDLIQRQEHGGQKEGQPLTWDDARRVVFSTALALAELSAAFEQAARE